MLKPVCTKCQRFFRPERNGYWFVEGKPKGGWIEPGLGTSEPEGWEDYKVWIGDLWKCQGCGHEIVVGTGLNPVSERHKDDFHTATMHARTSGGIRVNDC